MHEIDEELAAKLRAASTPTVCDAIEVVQGRRGFSGFTRQTVVASDPAAAPIFGRARTATILGAHPPVDPPDAIRERRMNYYRYMAEAPEPAIAVVEDVDGPEARGAFWGELNATLHRAFGLSGTLTNGILRDLGEVPEDYPIYAGAVGPSHGYVRVVATGIPVTVLGLHVEPGALIHADRHGAVVIPEEVIPALSAAIDRLRATEAIVIDPAREGRLDFDSFSEIWARFEAARV